MAIEGEVITRAERIQQLRQELADLEGDSDDFDEPGLPGLGESSIIPANITQALGLENPIHSENVRDGIVAAATFAGMRWGGRYVGPFLGGLGAYLGSYWLLEKALQPVGRRRGTGGKA